MKKVGFSLLVLIAVAGIAIAVWWFYLRSQRVYKAEEILPAATIALLDIPDADRARENWKKTPLSRIWNEPEVRDFLAKPAAALRSRAAAVPHAQEAQDYLDWLARIGSHFHGEAFMAFLGFDVTPNLQLQLVAGFDARKEASAAAKTIDELAADLRSRYPKGVREEKEHLGVRYETWSPSPQIVICHARLGNFFLFSSDELALQACIEHAKGKRENPLKSEELYKKTLAKVDDKHDALAYFNFAPVAAKFAPLLAVMAKGSGAQDLMAFKAAAMSSRFEPSGSVDKMFVMVPEATRPASLKTAAPWEKKSLPLVPADALIYGVKSFDASAYYDIAAQQATEAAAAPEIQKAIDQFNALIASQGIQLKNDLVSKLGREFAFHAEWGEADRFPKAYIMLETTDAAAVSAALDKLWGVFGALAPGAPAPATPGAAAGRLDTFQAEGKTIHRFLISPQNGVGLYYTDVAPFLVIAFQDHALPAYLKGIAAKQAAFSENATYKQLAGAMPKTTMSFLYCDNKPLFERVYGMVAPLAALGAAFLPADSPVDLTKLPKTDTIARHLAPSASYQYFDPEGVYRYGMGPVPPETPFLAAVLSAAGTASALTQGQGLAGLPGARAPAPPSSSPTNAAPQSAAPPAPIPPPAQQPSSPTTP